MISNNKWVVSGTVTDIGIEKGYFEIIVKGNISRPSLYNLKGVISCIVPYRLCKSITIGTYVTVKGKLTLGSQNYMTAEEFREEI